MSMLENAYADHGMDYAGTIDRCAGDEEMLRELLAVFAADASFEGLLAALDNNDARTAFAAAHALKGSTGMLGMTRLHTVMAEMTECLRAGDAVSANGYRAEAAKEYAAVIEMIRRL